MSALDDALNSGEKYLNKYTLIAIAAHDDGTGNCSVSHGDIKEWSGMSDSTIKRSIAALIESKALTVVSKGAGRQPSTYLVAQNQSPTNGVCVNPLRSQSPTKGITQNVLREPTTDSIPHETGHVERSTGTRGSTVNPLPTAPRGSARAAGPYPTVNGGLRGDSPPPPSSLGLKDLSNLTPSPTQVSMRNSANDRTPQVGGDESSILHHTVAAMSDSDKEVVARMTAYRDEQYPWLANQSSSLQDSSSIQVLPPLSPSSAAPPSPHTPPAVWSATDASKYVRRLGKTTWPEMVARFVAIDRRLDEGWLRNCFLAAEKKKPFLMPPEIDKAMLDAADAIADRIAVQQANAKLKVGSMTRWSRAVVLRNLVGEEAA
jgi:hypothetical protein